MSSKLSSSSDFIQLLMSSFRRISRPTAAMKFQYKTLNADYSEPSRHDMSQLRQRPGKKTKVIEEEEEEEDGEFRKCPDLDEAESSAESKESVTGSIHQGTYWMTRVVFLRYLSFIYLTAFIVSYNQNKELIGNNGLTPARNLLMNG